MLTPDSFNYVFNCGSSQDNILVDENGRALLADFGLANFDRSRHWLDITSQSTIPGGTPAYMAPELFSRETVGARSRVPLMKKAVDIYALGMVIYEVQLPIADCQSIILSSPPRS